MRGTYLQQPYYCFILVDGGYSKWTSWGKCTKDCKQLRIRECNNPSPKGKGKDCPGEGTEKRKCFTHVACKGQDILLYKFKMLQTGW